MSEDAENVFIVVMHSSALGAGALETALDKQTRTLLRAVHMQANGARVFRPCPTGFEEVVYDPAGDDMGNHEGHDAPFFVVDHEKSPELRLALGAGT